MENSILSTLIDVDPTSLVGNDENTGLANQLSHSTGSEVYPRSILATQDSLFFLCRKERRKFLGILTRAPETDHRFSGNLSVARIGRDQLTLKLCDKDVENARLLRELFPFLRPQTLGLRKSAGCGDRLGLATPGHIKAIRQSSMAPILAQQSVRENSRTNRTPIEVLDDAMWGVFQEGWQSGYGADADHLKSTADIDDFVSAGYTFYTIDPGDHVDNEAQSANSETLRQKSETIPWAGLETSPQTLISQLASRPIDLGNFTLSISEIDLMRAAAKYGRAVLHTVTMYRHLKEHLSDNEFELEMSVDETDSVTTLAEHIYIAHEMKRLGVKWASLAPRYAGTFEKGVDYIGDPADFERCFVEHLAVANTFGPYKLSLHSGSDKFSIYPIASKIAGNLVHLKTAGTSYLEALRAISILRPSLFRDIARFAFRRFPSDRASYHVSADISKIPDLRTLGDEQLPSLLEDFDCREALHVTYGSILNNDDLRGPIFETLEDNEDTHYQILETHFARHFAPFADSEAGS